MSYKGKTIDGIINIESIRSNNENVKIDITDLGDDKGISVTGGQFGVGSPQEGQESVFGGGDSYPVPIAFHYNIVNEVGSVITGANDITSILKSDTGSSVGLFETNLQGEVLLIGSDQPSLGAKIKYSSLGILEPNNVIGQYLNTSGVWEELSYMITESTYPYTRSTWELASYISEQIRFGIGILNPTLNTSKRILNINGVNIDKYWTRLILLTPITQTPIVEQIKIHPSRSEANSDGTFELFGLSRGIKDIITEGFANNLSDPSNENVIYFTGGINGGGSKLIDNEFSNNTRDSRIIIIKIDGDIDTSCPIAVSIPWYVKGIQTGDVRWDVEYTQITKNFVYGTLSEPDGTQTIITNIITPSNGERQVLQFEVPINKIDPEIGGVAVVITRDATLPEDTVNASCVWTSNNANVRGRRWKI